MNQVLKWLNQQVELLSRKFLLFPLVSNCCRVFCGGVRDDETELYNIGTTHEHHEHLFNECEIMNHVSRFLSRQVRLLTRKLPLFPLVSNCCRVFFGGVRDDETEFYNIGTTDEHHEHLFNECEIMSHVSRFLSQQAEVLTQKFPLFSPNIKIIVGYFFVAFVMMTQSFITLALLMSIMSIYLTNVKSWIMSSDF